MPAKGWKGAGPARVRRRTIALIVLILSLVVMVQTFVLLERNLREPLMNIAVMRVKQKATEAINLAISERMATKAGVDRLIEWQRDSRGNINGFMLNYAEHMRIAGETVQIVQEALREMERMPENIPLGRALDSAILSSFGPDVPIRFEPVGAVKVELGTRRQEAGINMLLVEVYIRVTAEVMIIVPFDTKPEKVETEIPISYVLVVGDVPMYYFDAKGNPAGNAGPLPPNVSLPVPERAHGFELVPPVLTPE
jgi:sporulation protein YunB